jgi:acid phosphatase
MVMTATDTHKWDSLQWQRQIELLGHDDSPIVATGANGEGDGVWYVPGLDVKPDRLCNYN